MSNDIGDRVRSAKEAYIRLMSESTSRKDGALEAMAAALDSERETIKAANAKDMKVAEQMVADGELTSALLKRLKVDDSKLDEMIAGINDVMRLPDPVGRTMQALELDDGLELFQVSTPIGLIGVIFESRPDVVPQIMALCLKSGNATIFKGGSEARESNRVLFDVLTNAIASAGLPSEAFQLMETRDDVTGMLDMDGYIDLIIPRGSNDFVRYIQDNTRIPVLGHAAGICHVYLDVDADPVKAKEVAVDSKVQYAAVCNAMETLLVHKDMSAGLLAEIATELSDKGVELRCDHASKEILSTAGVPVLDADVEDWDTEYNELILSVRTVDSLEDAVVHINAHGSGHTDCIVTDNSDSAKRFVAMVDSSSVMLNASTRFADGFRYGKGAEVGISTNKIHARGPVGMEGLMIYKYVLLGQGHVVKDYAGKGAKRFTHRNLSKHLEIR